MKCFGKYVSSGQTYVKIVEARTARTSGRERLRPRLPPLEAVVRNHWELLSVTTAFRRILRLAQALLRRKRMACQALRSPDRLILLEAAVVLVSVRLGLRLLPFQTVRSFLGRFAASAKRQGRPAAAGSAAAPRIVRAVDCAGRGLGLTCLPRALTTHALLARRQIDSTLRIGVTRTPGAPLEAHAWVERDGVVIMGELPNLSRFVKMPLSEWSRSASESRQASKN